MDPEFTELNPDPFLCTGQSDKQDQRTGQVGDYSRNRNTVYAHLKNNDKEQVQKYIQNTCKSQRLLFTLMIVFGSSSRFVQTA